MSNNNKTERLAVQAIVNESLKSEKSLAPRIPEGDKEPSFDGYVTVFLDSSETVESFEQNVFVQVKGTKVNKFSKSTKPVNLPLEHYINYYKQGGCIFFHVEIKKKNNKTKIYYKHLLPVELKQLISAADKNGRKSSSVTMRSLQKDNLYSVFIKFINEQKLQPQILVDKPFEKDFEVYQLRSTTINPLHHTLQDMIGHEITSYGFEGNYHYPLNHGRLQQITTTEEEIIMIDGEKFSFFITTIFNESDSQYEMIIEDVLKINIVLNAGKNEKKLNYKLLSFHSLEKQLALLPFLYKMVNAQIVKFKRAELSINADENLSKKIKDQIKKLYKYQRFYDDFGLDYSIKVEDDRNIESDIDNLLAHFYGERDDLPSEHYFISFPFGNKKVLTFTYIDHDSGKRVLHNAFSSSMTKISAYWQSHDKQSGGYISPFITLSDEILANSINLDTDIILSTFADSRMYSDFNNLAYLNTFCLNCLMAYDKNNNEELLNLVIHLLENVSNYKTNIPKENYAINSINLLQAMYRLNHLLSDEEKSHLYQLKNYFIVEENWFGAFCANVLLSNIEEANYNLSKIDEEIEVSKFPIYNIYEEMV